MTYAVSANTARGAVVAGYVLGAALAVVAVLHLYWVAGGTWGLAAALGRESVEPSTGLRVATAAVAGLLALAVPGVLARVGALNLPVPWRVVSIGAWALVGALVLVAVANATGKTSLERFGFAPLALALAALAFVVARAERPQ